MNKKLIKRVAVASLAALMSIPNIALPAKASVLTEEMNEEYTGVCFYLPIRSVSNMGNGLSKFIDDNGDEYIAYTSEIQEYQNLVAQGLDHKLDSVSSTSTHYIGQSQKEYITNYSIKGGQSVDLPNNALLSMKDKYSFGPLMVEKYLMGQQGTTNQMKKDLYLLKKNLAEDEAKRRAEAIKDQQEIELGKQIINELDMYSNNYNKNHNSQLPYTKDYLDNYYKSEMKKSREKVYASFDNERNYVQQWLDKHNLTLKQLRDMNYTTENLDENVKKYGKQMVQARVYYERIENGELPQNCSYGDWIRYMFKKNALVAWNWLSIWSEKATGTTLMSDHDSPGITTFQDLSRINQNIANMIIEKDLPVIASYKLISPEEKFLIVDGLCTSMHESIASQKLALKSCPSYISGEELADKVKDIWNKEYASKNN